MFRRYRLSKIVYASAMVVLDMSSWCTRTPRSHKTCCACPCPPFCVLINPPSHDHVPRPPPSEDEFKFYPETAANALSFQEVRTAVLSLSWLVFSRVPTARPLHADHTYLQSSRRSYTLKPSFVAFCISIGGAVPNRGVTTTSVTVGVKFVVHECIILVGRQAFCRMP